MYGSSRVILFGSTAESPQPACDIDLALEGIPDWEFVGLTAE